MPTLQFFPFGVGLHQENDDLLQNAGTPRALENFVRTKNGRLEARKDYETLALTAPNGVTALRLYDLHGFGDRLLAFGRCTVANNIDYPIDANERIFDLVEQPTHNWSRAPMGELVQAQRARKLGRIGRKVNSITRMDVAAGGGLVCLVYDVVLNPSTPTAFQVGINIINPVTDTVITSTMVSNRQLGRVCCVSGRFFITCVDVGDNSVEMFVYDPAVGTFAALTDLFAAGASAIVAYDLAPAHDTNTFWAALGRANTTTELRGCTNAGVINYTTAGPAILIDAISVLHHSTGGVDRLHVCAVRDTTLNIDLYTYLPPATVPAVSSPDILTPQNAITQPGLSLDPGGTSVRISHQSEISGIGTADVFGTNANFTTHALTGTSQLNRAFQNGKALDVRGRQLLPVFVEEEEAFFTHALMRLCDLNGRTALRPVCVTDRFLAQALDRVHLPSIAYDASTDLVYTVMAVEDEDRIASPHILELRVASAERRQTVVLGDVLYIAGSIVQAFDGIGAEEAGGFLTRPFIQTLAASGGAGGLDPGGTYQAIATMEYRDAKNRRMQSAPSNLKQGLDGGLGQLTINVDRGVTMRDSGVAEAFAPESIQTPPTVMIYRTLNIDNGNGTFHIDESRPVRNVAFKGGFSTQLTQSDVAISDNSILYTQGARGALSGPLEFVCPDSAGSICASADRIATAALVNDSQIQESRPLFPGEQVQWNDTAGFFRDIRARTLAIVRLDERRIIFTSTEIFECDGPGIDDNGLGDIGAPRRLPSDVGLHGGALGWRSIVEISAGILFQGLANQIYILPRGGVTPIAIGDPVEDLLESFPVITAAVYMNEDRTVRFCCQDSESAPTSSVVLLFDVRFSEWFVEGPYAFGIRAAAKAAGRFYLLTSAGAILRQRTQALPLVFVGRAWRGSWQHPHKPGMFGRVEAFWLYMIYRGNARVRAIVRFDDGSTETHPWFDVVDKTDGQQVRKRFQFDQQKCESFQVDFELEAFQGQATRGLDFIYWAVESEPAEVPNEVGPEDMT